MKLICPICGMPLETVNRSAVCENRHSFDYAKTGYLNLLRSGKAPHGDNAEMVKARTAFLNSGHYAFLRDAVADTLREEPVKTFADLGCGEGYYTALCPGEEKYGFDLSKDAINHAAKFDKTTLYAVASIFHLPLPDNSMDAVLTCFAPAAGEEVSRVLKPGGRFLFVFPAKRHLFELKEVLYEHPYENDEQGPDLPLTFEKESAVSARFHADHETLRNLFQMTPYAYRTGKSGAAKLEALDSLDITASFLIRTYRKDG